MNDWLTSPRPELFKLVCQIPLPDYIQTNSWKAKRFLDFFISGFLLIAFLPFIAALALLIRLSSSGPIFFRQERISQRGKPYKCLKFRTMRHGADTTPHLKILDRLIAGKNVTSDATKNNAPFKLRDDPRVTRIGRWIRRFSLDELPQLWNVFCGDMSLVGPQAPLAFEVERYQIEWLPRFCVPAGLTGPWQVMGRSRVPYARMIEMDLEYVSKWSFKKDIDLLFKTIFSVLLARGAY
jgi:lipopolysaccharide/colanic/teichoic acid biosynthesis glycosyltransferase